MRREALVLLLLALWSCSPRAPLIERDVIVPTAPAIVAKAAPVPAPAPEPPKPRDGVQAVAHLPPVRQFEVLIRSTLDADRTAAWVVAATHPSAAVADAVAVEISSRAAAASPATPAIGPRIARAASANRLREAYPLIRANLMRDPAGSDPALAEAMTSLRPSRASADLLGYLGLAAWREWRLGALTHVRRPTVVVALRHMASLPPPADHPEIGVLLMLAASGDGELARLACLVVDRYQGEARAHLAAALGSLPREAQEALPHRMRALLAFDDTDSH